MQPRAFFSPPDFELLVVERLGGMSKIRQARLIATDEYCALKYASNNGDTSELSFTRETAALSSLEPVSYTHLTLPTSDLV